jgi:hypothetical protein
MPTRTRIKYAFSHPGRRYARANDFADLMPHTRTNENAHRLLRLADNDRAHCKTQNHGAGSRSRSSAQFNVSQLSAISRAYITTRQKLCGFAAVKLLACARKLVIFPVCAISLPRGELLMSNVVLSLSFREKPMSA